MGFHESKWLNECNLNKRKDSLNVLHFLNNRHPNIKSIIEKQINHSIAFLDVFISGINNQNLAL